MHKGFYIRYMQKGEYVVARYNFADVVRRNVRSGEKTVYEYGMIVIPENDDGAITVITRQTRSRKYLNDMNKYIARFTNDLGEPEERLVYYGGASSFKLWSLEDRTLCVLHEATLDEMIAFLDFLHSCNQYDTFKTILNISNPDLGYEYCVGTLFEDDKHFIIMCSQSQKMQICEYIEIEKASGSVSYHRKFSDRFDTKNLKLIGLVDKKMFQKIVKIAIMGEDHPVYILPENATMEDVKSWLVPWSVAFVKQSQLYKKRIGGYRNGR